MAMIVLMDRNAGFIQWMGEAENPEAALRDHLVEVGGDFAEQTTLDDFLVYTLTDPTEITEVENWIQAGHPTHETPDCLR